MLVDHFPRAGCGRLAMAFVPDPPLQSPDALAGRIVTNWDFDHDGAVTKVDADTIDNAYEAAHIESFIGWMKTPRVTAPIVAKVLDERYAGGDHMVSKQEFQRFADDAEDRYEHDFPQLLVTVSDAGFGLLVRADGNDDRTLTTSDGPLAQALLGCMGVQHTKELALRRWVRTFDTISARSGGPHPDGRLGHRETAALFAAIDAHTPAEPSARRTAR